jgi:hypothetical protein
MKNGCNYSKNFNTKNVITYIFLNIIIDLI